MELSKKSERMVIIVKKTALFLLLVIAGVFIVSFGLGGGISAQEYPPGLSYAAVLNGVNMIPKDGRIIMNHIQGVFIPVDSKGYISLCTEDGTEKFRYDFRVTRLKEPYALLEIGGIYHITETGKYKMDFYLEDKKFYTFPFEVTKLTSSDPFDGGPLYFLEGDWSRWAYLYYADANPERPLVWKIWLRNKGMEINKDAVIKIELAKEGSAPIAVSRKSTSHRLRQQWTRIEFDFVRPVEGVSDGEMIRAKDLLKTDGNYTVKMTINNDLYGIWKFSVSGGKIQTAGRTVRGKADPLTFIEGGRDAFWLEKQ